MLHAGTHGLGPQTATLSVRTQRAGAAAKAGHNLLIYVTSWEATITVGDSAGEVSLALSADPTSLRVQEGHGGIQALDDGDLDNIHQTIDAEVLQRREIAFRSTHTTVDGDVVHVDGELTLFGNGHPISFDLRAGDDGSVAASATVRQSDWGIKPYSALFGSLRVEDEVEVALEGHVQNSVS